MNISWSGWLLFGMLASPAWAQDRPQLVKEEFHAWERGGTLVKTWQELGSQEAQVIITAACAAYGVDCSRQAAALRQAAVASRRLISTGNYRGTARIDRRAGNQWYAKFDSPAGYTICKAGIDIINGSITGGSTFNGTIQRTGEDGLGLYAVVPQREAAGNWVSFRLLAMYVPQGTLQEYGCWPNNALVFQCGPNSAWGGCKANPTYPAAYLQ